MLTKGNPKLISLEKTALSYAAGNLEHGDTIYLTVADKFGNTSFFN